MESPIISYFNLMSICSLSTSLMPQMCNLQLIELSLLPIPAVLFDHSSALGGTDWDDVKL